MTSKVVGFKRSWNSWFECNFCGDTSYEQSKMEKHGENMHKWKFIAVFGESQAKPF